MNDGYVFLYLFNPCTVEEKPVCGKERDREEEVKLKLKESGRATDRAVASGRIVTSAYVTINIELETRPNSFPQRLCSSSM